MGVGGGGLNACCWCQIFDLDSAVVEVQEIIRALECTKLHHFFLKIMLGGGGGGACSHSHLQFSKSSSLSSG